MRGNVLLKTHVKFEDNVEKNEVKKYVISDDEKHDDPEEFIEEIPRKTESEKNTGKESIMCSKINSMLLKINALLHETR